MAPGFAPCIWRLASLYYPNLKMWNSTLKCFNQIAWEGKGAINCTQDLTFNYFPKIAIVGCMKLWLIARWYLWYWYLDFYIDPRNIAQQCAYEIVFIGDYYYRLYEIVVVISMHGRGGWASAVYMICFIFTVLIMSVHLLFPFICHLFPYIFQKYMFRMCNLNAWRRPVIQRSGS